MRSTADVDKESDPVVTQVTKIEHARQSSNSYSPKIKFTIKNQPELIATRDGEPHHVEIKIKYERPDPFSITRVITACNWLIRPSQALRRHATLAPQTLRASCWPRP